ncbi:hypothetical protein EBT25_17460, partial [bacterium]|nr:hypothetical protein [bacterium]
MKIVILGCGSIGKCVLYYIPKFFRTSYKNVTVIDKDDTVIKFPAVQECIRKGATFLHVELTVANFEALFEKKLRLSKGDLLIDVTTRTPCFRFLKKCRQLNAHYISSSTEEDEEHMGLFGAYLAYRHGRKKAERRTQSDHFLKMVGLTD